MKDISMIGLDTSKSVFEVCGLDAAGQIVKTARLRRRQVLEWFAKLGPCTVVLEACGASYHWARCLVDMGHAAKLMPPPVLKRFRMGRHKNDARDAEALARAGSDASIRTVPVKSAAQQAQGLHLKVRALLVRQCTQSANSLRGLLSEFGLTAQQGAKGLEALIANIESGAAELPQAAIEAVAVLSAHWRRLEAETARLSAELASRARQDERSVRLMTIPGIGPIIASTLLAKIEDAARFECGRDLAAWIGLTPRQESTGGKTKLRSITKAGDEDLRWLLVQGAASLLMRAKLRPAAADPWIAGMVRRKPFKVAAVALAARLARVAWAILRHGGVYTPRHARKAAAA